MNDLSATEARALALADNRLAELATWDQAMLADELRDIADALPDISFEISDLGFEWSDVERKCRSGRKTASRRSTDPVRDLPANTQSVQFGDLWVCGDHVVACGDPTDAGIYEAVLGSDPVDVVVTEPLARIPDRGEAGGDVGAALTTAFEHVADRLARGASSFIFAGAKHLGVMAGAAARHLGEVQDVAAWIMSKGRRGAASCSLHRIILIAGRSSHRRCDRGRALLQNRIWTSSMTSLRHQNGFQDQDPKTEVIADLLGASTERGGLLLDPFADSAAGLLAAEQTRRRARLITPDPQCCAAILDAWRELAGRDPRLADRRATDVKSDWLGAEGA